MTYHPIFGVTFLPIHLEVDAKIGVLVYKGVDETDGDLWETEYDLDHNRMES